jgi:hypothetical protein
MTKRLDQAIARIRTLPDKDQDQLAEVLFAVLQAEHGGPELTDEELETVRRTQESVRGGDLATDHEMDEVWRRFGLA